MNNSRWAQIASDVTAALTLIAIIPYDKETMDLIIHLVPKSWLPWVIHISIAATLLLRLIGHGVPQRVAMSLRHLVQPRKLP